MKMSKKVAGAVLQQRAFVDASIVWLFPVSHLGLASTISRDGKELVCVSSFCSSTITVILLSLSSLLFITSPCQV